MYVSNAACKLQENLEIKIENLGEKLSESQENMKKHLKGIEIKDGTSKG